MNRVTQRDLAEAAGCSQMTVSRVLRGDSRVKGEIRAKVERLAEEMGYVPDPMLKALVTYKRGSQARHLNANLALLEVGPSGAKPTTTDRVFPLIQAGVKRRAAEMGFGLESFDAQPADLSPQRFQRVLVSRGVRGVVWTATRSSLHLEAPPIDIAGLCAVTVAFDFTQRPLNAINIDYHQAVRLAVEHALARGYRRIGLAVGKGHDIRERHAHTEAWWRLHRVHPAATEPEPLLFEESTMLPDASWAAWFERYRPDVVITGLEGAVRLQAYAEHAGLSIPGDVGLVSLDVIDGLNEHVAGIRCRREHLGAIAVETLYSMIATGEFGIPSHARRIVVQPEWNEGTTLPWRRGSGTS
ncbi:LacI family DNA-binding transcriptional regulator [Actomonas aquatica]|uniref:LacI family DNA-binding transcriptional regulator n=1 Tax=Actomonas aquatica TaxID=2866162 RepID=A0ABZ1C4T8_9BACT|nr:LacI family DNA-binding transcriptional regulator [Opitutus sp. WL0086]WRQ86402.1 LacI family DNA-binding transcriptional regulator [Opitutus sp. WL0086]